mgnify:CR=1 FL=1
MDFLYKLQRAGKSALYEKDPHTNLALLANINEDDILICISYGARSKEVRLAASYAKKAGAKIVSITKSSSSKLANMSDVVLIMPEIEKGIRFGAISSRFSSLIITDILFYGYISANMNEVIEHLKISKALTDNLKD